MHAALARDEDPRRRRTAAEGIWNCMSALMFCNSRLVTVYVTFRVGS